MKKKYLFSFIVFLPFCFCGVEPYRIPDLSNNPLLSDMDKNVEAAFQTVKADLNTVGMAIGIFKGAAEFYYGYGETKIGSGTIPNEHTFFEIGSVTKTFSAIATVAMLKEQGSAIDMPVRSFLPPDLPTLQRGGVEVTFKHLLTHTSGLPRMPDNMGKDIFFDAGKAYREYDQNKFYTFLKNVQLRFTPFTDWEYSNAGMGVCGTILQRVYGKSYSDIIDEQIVIPLGLRETRCHLTADEHQRFATGYASGVEMPHWESLNSLDAAGVIKSTCSDLIKYCRVNIDPPSTNLGIAIKATHQHTYHDTIVSDDGTRLTGCLGWFIYSRNGIAGSFLHHNGGTGGFNSEVFVNLERQSALVVLYNSTGVTEKETSARIAFLKKLLELLSR